jgi:trimeric autotransporter adhesin
MKKLYLSFLMGILCLFISQTTKSQVTIAGSTGADGTYTSLTLAGGAFATINAAGSQAGNNITVSITADLLAETGANALNANNWTTLTISPSGGVIRNVQGTAASPLIDLNGADNVTINGLNSGGNSLNITNLSNSATASTIRFINDATSNTLTNLNILGSSQSLTSGTVFFSTGTVSGNDNNTISQCIASAAAGGTPVNGIYSLGSSITIDNSGISVTGSNINDYFGAALSSAGINVSTNNSNWTITGNVFYQTATRTATLSNLHYGIFINNTGSGYTVNNNLIGGSNPSGGGTAWTYAGTFTNRFTGIAVSANAAATTNIQGNTIANFSVNTNSSASTTNGNFSGIWVSSGNANIGTVTGNTIGAGTGNGSINVNLQTNTGGIANLISYSGLGIVNISNNTIGAVTLTSSTAAVSQGVQPILVSGGTPTITNNIIGSSVTANSINSSTATTGGVQNVNGINVTAGVTVPTTISGNIIANLNQNGTSTTSLIRGIIYSGTGFGTITNNIVRDISGANANATLAGGATGIQGICYTGTSPAGANVSSNLIYTIRATNATAVATTALAIGYSNPTSGRIFKNTIYDIRNASTMAVITTPPVACGIMLRAAPDFMEVSNNMISLGNAQATNTEFIGIWNSFSTVATARIYYNSVNIEGAVGGAPTMPSFCFLRGDNTAASAIVTPVNIKNNIFYNTRSGAGSNHAAIGNNYGNGTSSATGWSTGLSNNNVLNSAAAGTFGYWSGWQTFGAWQTASAGDALSLNGNTFAPTFVNTAAGNLHLNMGVTPTPIESGGVAIAGLTIDYDNDVRPGPAGSVNGGAFASDLGADEFDGVPGADLFAPTISYTPLINTACTTDRTLIATATDNSGINVIAGTKPRLYYKRSTDGNLWNDNTNGTDGWKYVEASNAASPFSFTINYALLFGGGGVVIGNNVQYFVVAQDLATTPNVAINSGTFAVAPASVALTGAAFPLGGTINNYTILATGLSTTLTIGAAGDYTSLTGATGLFNAINTLGLSGNTTVNIMDASITETGAIALNQMVAGDCSASTYSLLIKPNTGVTSTLTGSLNNSALIRVLSNNVTIDGSNNGTTTRDLTITNTSVTGPTVLVIGSTGSIPVSNVTLRNSIIINGANTNTAVFISDGTTIGNAGNFTNVNITNNSVQRAFIGIYCISNPSAGNGNGLIISNNDLTTAGANSIRLVGIYIQGTDGATISNNSIANIANTIETSNISGIWAASGAINTTISGNTISTISGTAAAPRGIAISSGFANSNNNITSNTINGLTSSSTGTTTGILFFSSTSGVQIQKNNITNIKNTNATGFGSNGIQLSSSLAAAATNVNNNFISDVAAVGFAGTAVGDNGYGIIATAGGGYNIDYNSINLNTNQTTVGGLPAAINITTGVVGAGSLNIRNNIFNHSATGGSTQRYAILSTASNLMFGTIDYNDYYTTGANLGFIGSNRATLTDIQTGFGGNVNSLNLLPVFVSATNLHLDSSVNCALNGKGITIAGITTDIDNNTRDNPNPDMGADEFTSANLIALSGTPGVTTCESKTINPSGTLFVDAVCNRIARVVPSGASPVTGVVNTCIYVETVATPLPTYNAEPYLPVHFDVTPATNPLTSTGTITLFFLQSDFDNYNANNGLWPDLPNAPGDAVGISNLRISQYHGSANTNPSLPNQYSAGTATYINPADANIVWNVVNNYWEVTFNVTGFSGFYVHTNLQYVLPIVFNYLNGVRQGTNHLLNWKVTCNSSPTATLILERSSDNRTFTAINTVNATALRCADPFNYTDANPLLGLNYYRVKIIDANGKVSYGNTIALLNAVKGFEVLNVAPNPVTSNGAFKLTVSAAKAETIGIVITDMQGRVVERKQINIIGGYNAIPMNISQLASGTYNVQVTSSTGDKTKVLRVVKQ